MDDVWHDISQFISMSDIGDWRNDGRGMSDDGVLRFACREGRIYESRRKL